MESESSRFALIARRGRTIAVALAIGALGVGFTACGDDEQDQANDAVDSLQEELENINTEDIDTAEIQDQIDEAEKEISEALETIDTDELKDQAEELQKQLEEQGN